MDDRQHAGDDGDRGDAVRARHGFGAALLLATAAFGIWRSRPAFPHERHTRLFPTCAGCHDGVVTGDSTTRYPSPETCARCHDGDSLSRVTWSGPRDRPNNLRFSHLGHAREAQRSGTTVECQSCHRASTSDSSRMAVGPARPDNCIACHAHRAPEHLAESAVCSTCHVPLAQARAVSDSAIAAFPRPASHGRADFLSTHGPRSDAEVARCATCHTSESCARCHANASRVAQITALGSDARVARLQSSRPPVYATPASHASSDWSRVHGADAKRDVRQCANCHVQSGCRSCHTGSLGASIIAELPDGGAQRGTGVQLRHAALRDTGTAVHVHPAGFAASHAMTAASGRLSCQGCHEQRFCSTCHDGAGRRRFHAPNYLTRHAADAYSRDRNCSTCHQTETFCRTCHLKSGIASRGGIEGAAHNGQPLWLLQHGQAARQGLEGCTTCHQQRDCLRCHSATGLHMNPHGSGFDAARMQHRNAQVCRVCHLTDPIAK